jgi:hypothetical protein
MDVTAVTFGLHVCSCQIYKQYVTHSLFVCVAGFAMPRLECDLRPLPVELVVQRNMDVF